MSETSLNLTDLAERFREIPFWSVLPLELISAEKGKAEMKMKYQPQLNGVFGSLHGGFLMTLADSVACLAVWTLTGAGKPVTTTDMNIRFLAPGKSDIIAKARVVKFGRTLVPVEVDLFDADGQRVALSQVTYMRLG